MKISADILRSDIVFAIRTLRKDRAFTVLSIALLGLGMGFASAVFTLLWQALYAQLPVPNPEQIFTLKTNVTHLGRSDSDARAQTFSFPMYRYLAEHVNGSSGLIGRHGEFVNVDTPGGSSHSLIEFVTRNYFEVLQVKAVLGQHFNASRSAASGHELTAVLSYDFWQEAYGGQTSAWNSVVRINGVPFRIISIAVPGFKGLVAGQAPRVFLPVDAFPTVNPGWKGLDDWALRWWNLFVRLPDAATPAKVEAELQPVYHAAVREELLSTRTQSPDYLKELAHERASLIPASQGIRAALDDWQRPLQVLQWMTIAILFLAAINVAGLMVVRAIKRRQEVLIRYAVGAKRTAVMRLQFLQIAALAIAGGALGMFISERGSRILVHLARMDRDNVFLYRAHGWVFGIYWATVVLTAVLIGSIPALQVARVDLSTGLNEGALSHSGTRSQSLTRRSLAAAQIALSILLAIMAGLFAKTLNRLVSVPVGFNAEHVSVFSVDAKLASATIESTRGLWAQLHARLRDTSEVQAVTYGTGGPFPQGVDSAVVIPGSAGGGVQNHQGAMRSTIGPQYFSTLGIPVVAGREFDSRDRPGTPDVVILNQTLARKLFGNSNPVGQTVTMFNGIDPNWLATVVGVVADHHQSWRRATASLVYTPAQQARRVTDINFYVRTQSGFLPEQTIRELVRKEAPGISPYDIAAMPSRMAEFASGERTMSLLLGIFAAVAVLISATGIYGVVAYSASLRKMEFAVRLSVGARPADILKLMLREVGLIMAGGICGAIPLTYFGLLIVRHQMQGVSIQEPYIYVSSILALALCSLLAAYIPARRAMQISVQHALRHS